MVLDDPIFRTSDAKPTLTDDYIEQHPLMNAPHLYSSYKQLATVEDGLPYDPFFKGFLPQMENFNHAVVYITTWCKDTKKFQHGRFSFQSEILYSHLISTIKTKMELNMHEPKLFYGRNRVRVGGT